MSKKNRDVEQLRKDFDDKIQKGELAISETIVSMRKIVGLTQPKYAKLVKVAERTLKDAEGKRGNPTIETLNKIGAPFGLKVGFIKINS